MTNEEKAREIENDIVYRGNQPVYYMAVREAAFKMAEWKDQQFKVYLENRRNRIAEIDTKDYAGWEMHYMADITEIIDELFGEK